MPNETGLRSTASSSLKLGINLAGRAATGLVSAASKGLKQGRNSVSSAIKKSVNTPLNVSVDNLILRLDNNLSRFSNQFKSGNKEFASNQLKAGVQNILSFIKKDNTPNIKDILQMLKNNPPNIDHKNIPTIMKMLEQLKPVTHNSSCANPDIIIPFIRGIQSQIDGITEQMGIDRYQPRNYSRYGY